MGAADHPTGLGAPGLTRWVVVAFVVILVCGVVGVVWVAASGPSASPPATLSPGVATKASERPSSTLPPAAVAPTPTPSKAPASPDDVQRARTAATVAAGGFALFPQPDGSLVASLRADHRMLDPAKNNSVYYCRAYSLNAAGRLTAPHHAVTFDGLVLSRNLHHMLLYACIAPVSPWMYRDFYTCGDMGDVPCNTIIAGTSDQNATFHGPSNAGIALGKGLYGDVFTDIVFQLHYTPKALGERDNSGFDIYMTPHLRPHNIGSPAVWYQPTGVVNGTELERRVSAKLVTDKPQAILDEAMYKDEVQTTAPVIPPNTPLMEFTATCPPLSNFDALRYSIPESGANVTHVWPHMHLTGARILVELFRLDLAASPDRPKWRFVQDIYRWDTYFFHGQRFFELSPPVQIFPTDLIVTHCWYNTTGRPTPTQIGLSIQDEMCNFFMATVPQLPFATVSALAAAGGREPLAALALGSLCQGGVRGWKELKGRLVVGGS